MRRNNLFSFMNDTKPFRNGAYSYRKVFASKEANLFLKMSTSVGKGGNNENFKLQVVNRTVAKVQL